MTKEVTIKRNVEFVFSLIASILGFGSGLFVLLFGGIASAFGASSGIMILGISGIIFSIIGFVSCAIVKDQAKLAGTMMIVAGLGGAIVNGGFYILPAIMFLIAGIVALVKHDKGYKFDNKEKMKVGITAVVGLILIIILANAGFGSTTETNFESDENLSVIPTELNNLDIEDIELTTDNQIEDKPKTTTYNFGNPFLIDNDIEVNVEKITFAKNVFESDNEYYYLKSEDGQMYVVLDIYLKNVTNNVVSVFFPSPELIDQDSYSYKSGFMDSMSIKNSLSFSESILPNSIKRGRILFKVPENVTSLKLVFKNSPYVYVIDLPIENKEIWFSTTDKDIPTPVMKIRIKEISSNYFDSWGGTIYSVKLNITNDSNYPIESAFIEGKITNEYDDDIDIYFEEVLKNVGDSEDVFISINADDLDEEYKYRMDVNLIVRRALIDKAAKTFALSD